MDKEVIVKDKYIIIENEKLDVNSALTLLYSFQNNNTPENEATTLQSENDEINDSFNVVNPRKRGRKIGTKNNVIKKLKTLKKNDQEKGNKQIDYFLKNQD